MESVGDILQHVCPCGGDPSFDQHEESLLHRQWLLGKGITNAPDAIPTIDPRTLRPVTDTIPPLSPRVYDLG